jgi:CTP:molybdopterin cytidylyltransferase MocA
MFRTLFVSFIVAISLTGTARAQDANEPSDADLMYKAVKQWRGDSAESKVVDRVMADSKRESEQNGRAYKKKIASMFWRDPFSDSPKKLIPVRPEDREAMAEQGDSPKVYKELVKARAEAAMARAEAAKARADVARAEAVAARAEAMAARQACSEVNGGRGSSAPSADYSSPRPHASGQARHLTDRADRADALNRLVSRRDARRAEAAQAAAAPAPEPAAAPPVSSDPRGIIVIPITATIPKR